MKTRLYHCSPSKIEKINSNYGQFDGALFFSLQPYSLSHSPYTYEINLSDDQIIEVSSLECQESVDEIKDLASRYLELEICDDVASELLNADESIFDLLESESSDVDFMDASEFDWALQGIQAKAANNMGYTAAQGYDEQGAVYIINLVNKEHLISLSS